MSSSEEKQVESVKYEGSEINNSSNSISSKSDVLVDEKNEYSTSDSDTSSVLTTVEFKKDDYANIMTFGEHTKEEYEALWCQIPFCLHFRIGWWIGCLSTGQVLGTCCSIKLVLDFASLPHFQWKWVLLGQGENQPW